VITQFIANPVGSSNVAAQHSFAADFAFILLCLSVSVALAGTNIVSIVGDDFYLNGHPTCKGRIWNGHRIEGGLMNCRMVQGAFANSMTVDVATESHRL
jgi:hypothetical protein